MFLIFNMLEFLIFKNRKEPQSFYNFVRIRQKNSPQCLQH